MLDFIYKKLQGIKTFYRTIFGERKPEVKVTDEAAAATYETMRHRYRDSEVIKAELLAKSKLEQELINTKNELSRVTRVNEEIEELIGNQTRTIKDQRTAIDDLKSKLERIGTPEREVSKAERESLTVNVTKLELARLKDLLETKTGEVTLLYRLDDENKAQLRSAGDIVKDQRKTIDDLMSKLQRSSEVEAELKQRIDTMSNQVLSAGIKEDESDIKNLTSKLDRSEEALKAS
jgi:small-conductance mechanosensitive channel